VKQGIGEKVLSWFVVREDDEASAPEVEAIAHEVEDEAPHTRRSVAPSGVVPAPSAPMDPNAFIGVYRAAGVADADRVRLTKLLDLLAALPAEASEETKRTIVSASLAAFDVRLDQIVGAGEGAMRALDAYVAASEARTEENIARGDAHIAKLEAEIAQARTLMDRERASQSELASATAREKRRIEALRHFFEPKKRALSNG
jgi:hypothetical protein